MTQHAATKFKTLQHTLKIRHSVGLYHPKNDVTNCNRLQHTATHFEDMASYASSLSCEWGNTLQLTPTHIEDMASSASSPPCSLYVLVSVLCVHIVYVCVSQKSHMKIWHFWKLIFAWCYWSVCCMVLQRVEERLLQTITFFCWYGCGVATMSRLPQVSRLSGKWVLQK